MTRQIKKTTCSKAFGQGRTDRWSAPTLPVAPWLLVLVYTFLMVWIFQIYVVGGIRADALPATWIEPSALGLTLYEILTISNCLFLVLLVGHALLSPFTKARRVRWRKVVTLALAILLLAASQRSASGWKAHCERYMEEVAAMQRETKLRIPLIEAECARLEDHPWAGEYFHEWTEASETLRYWISPESGYARVWTGPDFVHLDRAELITSYGCGEVELEGGALRLSWPHRGVGFLYVPVSWGERQYLVPVEWLSAFKSMARQFEVGGKEEPRLDRRRPLLRRVSPGGAIHGEPQFPPGY